MPNEFTERAGGAVAGVLSGITKLVVGHPFDTIKVRLQTQPADAFAGPLQCLRRTIAREGILALYKGASPPLIGWVLMDTVQMATLNQSRLFFHAQHPSVPLNLVEHGLCGLVCGLAVACVATPIELLKCQLQTQFSNTNRQGPVDFAKRFVADRGIRGLYRGLAGGLLFRSFFWVLWSSYEVYSRALRKSGLSSQWIPFVAGGLAANTFWCIAFPAGDFFFHLSLS